MSHEKEMQDRLVERVIKPVFNKILPGASIVEVDFKGIELKAPMLCLSLEENQRAVPVAQIHDETVVEIQENLDPRQCCKRDHNFDGNCDIHESPGVLRHKGY